MPESTRVTGKAALNVFTIHIGAGLSDQWAEWFADAEITVREDGTGLITAAVRDQAMLFGLLLRVRDLGIPLLGLYPGGCGGEER